jgi:hypothetical protein
LLGVLSPTATVTPSPTATRTLTPVPTNTRTITPDHAATQQAQLEAGIRAQLDAAGLPSDTGYLGWMQTEPQEIPLTGTEGYYYTFAEDLNVSDFVIQTDITWDTDSWPWCGFYFRSDAQYAQGSHYTVYFLRFSGLPAWDIEYYRNSQYITRISQNYQYSSALDSGDGATNQITMAAQGNQFKVYVNGHYEGVFYDYGNYLDKGRFAFIATQRAGNTTCTFDNTWIWVYR